MSSNERELTILFADIAGSARLYEKLGNAEAAHAVDRCLKRIERAVESFEGRVLKVVGDEVMATFPTAEDAFQAVVEMHERVHDLPPVSGVKLGIRVGFCHGSVIQDNEIVFGATVSAAARFAGVAKPGQALTCSDSLPFLPEWARLATRQLEPVTIKGFDAPVVLHEVLWQPAEPAARHDLDALAQEVEGPGAAAGLLRITRGGASYLLGDTRTKLSFGRDLGSDVVIRDRRASRVHARIEQRGSDYFYVDVSTNGTFITFGNEPERFVRRAEIRLQGRGRLSFAASVLAPDADIAEFEQI